MISQSALLPCGGVQAVFGADGPAGDISRVGSVALEAWSKVLQTSCCCCFGGCSHFCGGKAKS